jgi:hypothetical protein
VTPHDSDTTDSSEGSTQGADADTEAGGSGDDEPPLEEDPRVDAPPEDGADDAGGSGRREVVVPMRLYKTVTVVATLLAMVGVVGGFVLLDAATDRGSAASLEEIDPVVALLGLAFLVGGAATYAFSTRFRAEGMGRSKTDEDQPPGNG